MIEIIKLGGRKIKSSRVRSLKRRLKRLRLYTTILITVSITIIAIWEFIIK